MLAQVRLEGGTAKRFQREEPDGVQLSSDRDDVRAAKVSAQEGLITVAERGVGQPQARPGGATDWRVPAFCRDAGRRVQDR